MHFAILLNKYCSNMALRHILNELEKLESYATPMNHKKTKQSNITKNGNQCHLSQDFKRILQRNTQITN